jgi:hypothetical protein
MRADMKWPVYLFAVAVVAYLAFGPRPQPQNPPDADGWVVHSVMLIRTDGAKTYLLQPPYRVIQDGDLIFDRPEPNRTMPVMRVEFTVGGSRVTTFARIRE